MAIACVYCGGEHATAHEVRACWQHSASAPFTPVSTASASTAPTPAAPAADSCAGSGSSHAAATPFSGAGPDELARGLVIRAGAMVPPPWRDAERLVIDARVIAAPEAAVALLAEYSQARRRVVIELGVPFAHAPRSTTNDPPFRLGATFWFALDVLFHVVWNNAIDATGSEPHWWAFDRALSLGAGPGPDLGAGRGDVMLPDGSAIWLDGGPIRRCPPIAGVAVLHTVALEHGSLTPPLDVEPTAELADDQRAAVAHLGAAARIIAPAGSGKTRVLTE
ncbi:MAG: hypothetical protein ABIW84_07810, partial [Ilumatobacteraceae bacterium]